MVWQKIRDRFSSEETLTEEGAASRRLKIRMAGGVLLAYLLLCLVLGFYWSGEPEAFSVPDKQQALLAEKGLQEVVGTATTATLIHVATTLFEKPGGYLSNDIMPPGVWLDNIPSWEYGVLIQIRDMSKTMRESFSRSQTQSIEDSDLVVAEPGFNFPNDSWMLPASERQYREAISALESYLARLADPAQPQAQFYARADNLNAWLSNVESRLGSLSKRLGASVAERRINTDLAGDSASARSTPAAGEDVVKTPWLDIDNVFYEARGAAWALIHFLKAVEVDFAQVLADKNAGVSLAQIIRELEATQQFVFSPIILNGSGFGLVANHSLVMASYISRANAALIDLRSLLSRG